MRQAGRAGHEAEHQRQEVAPAVLVDLLLLGRSVGVAGEWQAVQRDAAQRLLAAPDLQRPRLKSRHSQTSEAHFCLQKKKSTRLNSSHSPISYAVFCLKKKKQR